LKLSVLTQEAKPLNYTEASLTRIFILRLHHDETLHEVIEKFAEKKEIKNAMCFFLGGTQAKSKIVVGPKEILHLGSKESRK